jgi:hypothetical protein
MTAICPSSGPSTSKPGFNLTVVTTGAAIEGILTLLGLEPIAAILAPFIAGEVYDLTTFCTVDPPSTPTITIADITALQDWSDPAASLAAVNKFRQWFNSYFWFQVCECAPGPTPNPPTLTAPSVSTNPTLPPGPGATPCWQVTNTFTNTFTTAGGFQDISNAVLPSGVRQTVTAPFTGGPTSANLVPTGTVSITTDITRQALSGFGDGVSLYMWNSAGTILGNFSIFNSGNGAGVEFVSTHALVSGTTAWAIVLNFPSAAGSATDIVAVTVNCNNVNANTPNTPCCPPDQTLYSQLNAILQLCQAIFAGLPVVPTTFHTGLVHSGLSGSGAISLAAAPFAIQVDITTDPTTLGVDPGNPSYLFDRGFIVPKISTAGILEEHRLTYNPQWFYLPQLTETVAYTLHPGVVISITELAPN